MDKLFSRCKRCGMTADVPYMLICPRCGGEMHTNDNSSAGAGTVKFGLWSAYTAMFKKATDFKTRSRRSEYWYASLMNFIISVVVIAILVTVQILAYENLTPSGEYMAKYVTVFKLVYYLYTVYSLIVLIPQLALTVRRLNDIGRSPLFAVFAFSPILSLALIYFMVQDSAPGENRHGPNPKGM